MNQIGFSKTNLTVIGSICYIVAVVSFFADVSVVASAIVMILLLVSLFRNILGWKSVFVFYTLFALGLLNCNLQVKHTDALTKFVYTRGTLTGFVDSIPTTNIGNKTKFFLKTTSYVHDGVSEVVDNSRTVVSLSIDDADFSNIKIGDKISLNGSLMKPSVSSNPSQFDYSKYLKMHNVFTTFYSFDKDWKVISSPNCFSMKFLQVLNEKRNSVIEIHKKYLKSPNLEVLGGIVFGDDAINPPEDVKQSFVNSGLLHILAASGMNVSIIFGLWFFIAMRLRVNYRISIFVGAMLVAFYTLMTGLGPSVLRAALMIEFILLGKLIDRNADSIALVFFVAILLLLYNPAMINDVGFQLSFVVTFALMYMCSPILGGIKNKYLEFLAGAIMIPIVAQLWAAPIQMFYFNTFAVYSIFANFLITPFIMIISFLGFISSIIAMFPSSSIIEYTCAFLDNILNPVITGLVGISNYFSELPNSLITTVHPDLFTIIFYYLLLVMLGVVVNNICCTQNMVDTTQNDNRELLSTDFPKKGVFCFGFIQKIFDICLIRKKMHIILLFILFLLFLLSLVNIDNHKLEIIAFDVGNADSFLIKTPMKKYILIDTGLGSMTSDFSRANAIISKYLKDKGIKTIDVMILTHYDADHSGGAIDIMKSISVQNLILNKQGQDTNIKRKIFSYVKENKQPYYYAENKQLVYEEDELKVINYLPSLIDNGSDNDNSIITHLSYGDFDILFMGDAGVKSFLSIKHNLPKDVKYEVLKVGHHGANDVINKEMIEWLGVDNAIISTGRNRFGHPAFDTLEILYKSGVKIYRTDIDNAIKIVSDGRQFDFYKYNTQSRKFVLSN